MIDYARITELFQQKDFQEEASACKTMQDFHALFLRKGVEISEEETVDLISKIAVEKQRADNGELSEEALDDVSGGVALTGAAAVAACVGVGVAGVGAFALTAFVAYQGLRWAYNHKH